MSEKIQMAGVSAAIANAARLLDEQPALAARQARELLKVVPGHPGVVLLLGVGQLAKVGNTNYQQLQKPAVKEAAAALTPCDHSSISG